MSDKKVVLMLKAVKAKFLAEREENLAVAAHYLSASVGVGEHPQLVEAAVEAIKKASEAQECLDFVSSGKFQSILEHTTGVGKFFSKDEPS
jgi:hypothetical protein